MEPGTPGVPDAGVVQLVSTVACQVIDAGSSPVAVATMHVWSSGYGHLPSKQDITRVRIPSHALYQK